MCYSPPRVPAERPFTVTMSARSPAAFTLQEGAAGIGFLSVCALVSKKGLLTILPRHRIETFGFFSAGIIPAESAYLIPDALSTAFYPGMRSAFQQRSSAWRAA